MPVKCPEGYLGDSIGQLLQRTLGDRNLGRAPALIRGRPKHGAGDRPVSMTGIRKAAGISAHQLKQMICVATLEGPPAARSRRGIAGLS